MKTPFLSTNETCSRSPFIWLLLLALFLWPRSAYPHPHAFADCRMTIVFDEEGLAGIQVRAKFDEAFSNMVLQEFATDDTAGLANQLEADLRRQGMSAEQAAQMAKDLMSDVEEAPGKEGDPGGQADAARVLAGEELRQLEQEVQHLECFTHILVDGKRMPVREIEDFSVEVEDDCLVFDYFVPCPVAAADRPVNVVAAVYDATYYRDLHFASGDMAVEGRDLLSLDDRAGAVEGLKYYYGQVVPTGLSINFQRKTGAPAALGSHALVSSPGPWQSLIAAVNARQKQLMARVTRFGRDLEANPYGRSFWLFLAFAFVYGMIHALGPGHGKSIVCSYFLSRRGRAWHGLLMGNLITVSHVFSAVVVIGLCYWLLETTQVGSLDNARRILEKVSYSFITVLGLILVAHAVHEIKARRRPALESTGENEAGLGSLTVAAVLAGLVPCPGASVVLLFAIAMNALIPGLLAVLCMALGMGVTNTAFALLTIVSRTTLLRLSSARPRTYAWLHGAFSLAGASFITLIGAVLLFQSIMVS